MPPDLKNVVSETTLKVLEGGNVSMLTDDGLLRKTEKPKMSEAAKQYQHFIQRPIVKKDTQTDAQRRYEKPTLDISLTHVSLLSYCPSKFDNGENIAFSFSPSSLQIPVWSHLRIHPTVAINLPQTIPKCLETNNLPNLQYIFLEPDELKTE